jgi:hypothetical protein
MKRERVFPLVCIAVVMCAFLIAESSQGASAQACEGQGVEGDLTGSADTAVILGRASAICTSGTSLSPRQPVPYLHIRDPLLARPSGVRWRYLLSDALP